MGKNQEFRTVRGYQNLKKDKKVLTSSMEDYMEMIYRSCIKDGYIRINTLAELLNVQAPSASKVVKKLSDLGLIIYEKYGIIQLAEKGAELGKFLLNRHITVETFLKNLGIKNTLMDTEMIEHNLSMDTYKRLDSFNKFIEKNPDVLKKFKKFLNECMDEE